MLSKSFIQRQYMKKIIYLIYITVGLINILYATESITPPAYSYSSRFLSTLNSHNAHELLYEAETIMPHDYLHGWGLICAATAFEKDGAASLTIARRLLSEKKNIPLAEELQEQDFNHIGRYYLRQSCLQENQDAQELHRDIYFCEHETYLHDPTLPTFRDMVTRREQLSEEQLYEYILRFNDLAIEWAPKYKHSLRALTLGLIAHAKFSHNTRFSTWLSHFIADTSEKHIVPYDFKLSNQVQKIFRPRPDLALTYLEKSLHDKPSASLLLLKARMHLDMGDQKMAEKWYNKAIISSDFKTLKDHKDIERRISLYFDNNCVIL